MWYVRLTLSEVGPASTFEGLVIMLYQNIIGPLLSYLKKSIDAIAMRGRSRKHAEKYPSRELFAADS